MDLSFKTILNFDLCNTIHCEKIAIVYSVIVNQLISVFTGICLCHSYTKVNQDG